MRNKQDEQPMTTGELWTALFFLAIVLGLFVAETVYNFHPYKVVGLLFVLFWMPLMILHEFGHATVAWLLGWRVRAIVLGMGKLLTTFRIGRTPVEVRLVLTTGFVVPQPRRIRWPQLESALIYFAGPGIELLLVAVIVALVGVDRMTTTRLPETGSPDYLIIFLQGLCLAALTGALMNLFPFTSASPGGDATASDGLGILRSFFMPTEYYARMIDRDGEDRPPWEES
jgi:hypothetical protein